MMTRYYRRSLAINVYDGIDEIAEALEILDLESLVAVKQWNDLTLAHLQRQGILRKVGAAVAAGGAALIASLQILGVQSLQDVGPPFPQSFVAKAVAIGIGVVVYFAALPIVTRITMEVTGQRVARRQLLDFGDVISGAIAARQQPVEGSPR